MSYCRWSDDDFQCDLYCYEYVDGGWNTHVAMTRPDWTPPPGGTLLDLPGKDAPKAEMDAWIERYNGRHEALEAAPKIPIGGPHDGETFNDPTLEDFRERLLALRAAGYQFPDETLDAVDEEIRAEAE